MNDDKELFNDESYEDKEPLDPPPEALNVFSWLLNFTPEQLLTFALLIAIFISNELTLEEKTVVGSFLSAISENIDLLAAQEDLINTAADERKAIEDYKKMLRDKELEHTKKRQEAIEKKKAAGEKQKLLDDINHMKEQIKKLESIINKDFTE